MHTLTPLQFDVLRWLAVGHEGPLPGSPDAHDALSDRGYIALIHEGHYRITSKGRTALHSDPRWRELKWRLLHDLQGKID